LQTTIGIDKMAKKIIISVFIITLVMYILGAFVCYNINFKYWAVEARMFMVLLWFVSVISVNGIIINSKY
jgi:hypothetical protein